MATTKELSTCVDGETITYNEDLDTISAAVPLASDQVPTMVAKSGGWPGASQDFSRGDHSHEVVTGQPVALQPGDASDEGSSAALARAGHRHALPPFGTAAGTFMEGNATLVSGALKSATTTIDVGAAAAPTPEQVLTAVDSTHATWQLPVIHDLNTVGPITTGGSRLRGDGTRVGTVPDVPLGQGVVHAFSDAVVAASGAQNAIPIYDLRFNGADMGRVPALISMSATSTETARAAFVWSGASDMPYGACSFSNSHWFLNLYCSVDAYAAGDDPSVQAIPYVVVHATGQDNGAGSVWPATVTTTGSGTSRTATFSEYIYPVAGYPTNYLQTTKGLFQVTAEISPTQGTISVPSGYVNESAVDFFMWRRDPNWLDPLVTPPITATAAPVLYTAKAGIRGKVGLPSSGATFRAARLGVILLTRSQQPRTLKLGVNGDSTSYIAPPPSELEGWTTKPICQATFTKGNYLKVASNTGDMIVSVMDAGLGHLDPAFNFTWASLSETIDVSLHHNFTATNALGGNSTLTLTNGVNGCIGTIGVKQNAVGNWTLSFVVGGRTVLKSAADTNPSPAANSFTQYRYEFCSIAGTACCVISKQFLV